jgi:predicted sulfurtransferase
MESTTGSDFAVLEGGSEEMERGVNIVTNSQPVIVDGADEAIERYNKGEISAQELYDLILDADVVYVDRSNSFEFKESKDINSSEE